MRWSAAARSMVSSTSCRATSSLSGPPASRLITRVMGSMGERCSTMAPSGASTRAAPSGTETGGR